MARLTQLCTSTILATLIATAPALADITAKEVWDNWQNQLTTRGYELSFDEAMSGGILTINNLTLTLVDDDQQTSTITLGPVGYREQGDGSVEVILATDTPVTFKTDDMSLAFNQHHTGLSYIISGAPEAISHSIQADAISLTLTEMTDKGVLIKDAKIDLLLTALSGTSFLKDGDPAQIAAEFTIGNFAYDIDLKDAGEVGKSYVWNGSFSDLFGKADIVAPKDINSESPPDFFEENINFDVSAGYGGINSNFSFVGGDKTAKATFASNSGSLEFALGSESSGLIEAVQKLTLGAMALDFSATNIKDTGDVALKASISNIKEAVAVSFPVDFDPDQMPAAIAAGMAIEVDFSHGALSADLSIPEGKQPMAGTMSIASGDVLFGLDRERMRYRGGMIDAKMAATISNQPISAIEYSIGEVSFNLESPASKSTTPAPFTIQYRIADLWAGEDLWRLFDPTGLLSHEAATVNLDITGMGNWLIDILDAESEEARNTEVKGELHALTLNALQVTGAGINLTGAGDFTFDNDDLDTFKGMPAPTGTMNLKLTGGNALIDTLIEMGLLPADEAMGARLALSLLTIAGEGDDTLISDIEITSEGQVLANGKRLK